jgi:Uma2 family endonuclease
MATATPEVETPTETGEQHLVLHGVEWDQYVTINDALAERRGVRMIYVDGSLMIVTLSHHHDWFIDLFDAIVKAVALGSGVKFQVVGSATLRLPSENVGVEADRAYDFGENAVTLRGPVEIDLATQPPPDLAIEVEVTHSATRAIDVHARIGVPEVWRYDARRGTLTFLELGEGRVYQPRPRSRNLPELAPEDVVAQLRLAEAAESTSSWYAQLPEWVRTTVVARGMTGTEELS